MLRGCLQEEGLSRDELFKQVRLLPSPSIIAITYLSNPHHFSGYSEPLRGVLERRPNPVQYYDMDHFLSLLAVVLLIHGM